MSRLGGLLDRPDLVVVDVLTWVRSGKGPMFVSLVGTLIVDAFVAVASLVVGAKCTLVLYRLCH